MANGSRLIGTLISHVNQSDNSTNHLGQMNGNATFTNDFYINTLLIMYIVRIHLARVRERVR